MTEEVENQYVRGVDLKIGDRVLVWFNSGKGSVVVGVRDYTGKVAEKWYGERVRIFEFTASTESGTTEMTVADSALFTRAPAKA